MVQISLYLSKARSRMGWNTTCEWSLLTIQCYRFSWGESTVALMGSLIPLCRDDTVCHRHVMTGTESSEDPDWGFPISAPMNLWGIPGLQVWQVARLWKNAWVLLSPPFHFLFPCNVLWCSPSLDLVKRSSGVAWQQPSAALSFQSPCSAIRLPPESRQDFPLFLHGSTFSLSTA